MPPLLINMVCAGGYQFDKFQFDEIIRMTSVAYERRFSYALKEAKTHRANVHGIYPLVYRWAA